MMIIAYSDAPFLLRTRSRHGTLKSYVTSGTQETREIWKFCAETLEENEPKTPNQTQEVVVNVHAAETTTSEAQPASVLLPILRGS
jgi:hypothetical protein